MKKIINGKRFDTKTATLIGKTDNLGSGVDSITDFGYWEAGLYQTPRSKQFFLAGAGGPMSRFAMSTGQNQWSSGEGIIVLSHDDALAFAEAHFDPAVIEIFFNIEDA